MNIKNLKKLKFYSSKSSTVQKNHQKLQKNSTMQKSYQKQQKNNKHMKLVPPQPLLVDLCNNSICLFVMLSLVENFSR